MKRRDVVGALAGTALAWPVVVPAQQAALAAVGFVSSGSSQERQDQVAAFLKGLQEAGYVSGQSVAVDYRWADDSNERGAALVAEMVRLKPAVIVASTATALAQAAKAATASIPIVFCVGGDPVRNGLVASLNRPGGNVTGVSYLSNAVAPKRLELIGDVLPQVRQIAHLVNPTNPNAVADSEEMQVAAKAVGRQTVPYKASSKTELEAAFADMQQRALAAVIVASDTAFLSWRAHIVGLAAKHRIVAVYDGREYVLAGGLASYGANRPAAFRTAGIIVGKILKGAKPADLPVEQPTTLELVVNIGTARALGINLPVTLLARAGEIID